MSDLASLQLCNLVAQGVPMAEARKRLGLNKSKVVEEPAKEKKEETPEKSDYDDRKAIMAELKDMGIKFSPNAGLKNLQNKLKQAKEEAETL